MTDQKIFNYDFDQMKIIDFAILKGFELRPDQKIGTRILIRNTDIEDCPLFLNSISVLLFNKNQRFDLKIDFGIDKTLSVLRHRSKIKFERDRTSEWGWLESDRTSYERRQINGEGIKIAVLDTGFRGLNIVDFSSRSEYCGSYGNHGDLVMAVIATVAPSVTFIPVSIYSGCETTSSVILSALCYAAEHAHITNFSHSFGRELRSMPDKIVQHSLNILGKKVLIVCPIGLNAGSNNNGASEISLNKEALSIISDAQICDVIELGFAKVDCVGPNDLAILAGASGATALVSGIAALYAQNIINSNGAANANDLKTKLISSADTTTCNSITNYFVRLKI